MKKILVIMLFVLLGGAYFFYFKNEDGLNTYRNTRYGYSVKYSNDWSVEEGTVRFPKDNVSFRPVNFKQGDNWVEIYAGGRNVPTSSCGSTTTVNLSGIESLREVCKGGNGGIPHVNYYLTDKNNIPFVISVLYTQSTDYKKDPLVSTIKFNLQRTNKVVSIPNKLVLVKGKFNTDFSVTELNAQDNDQLNCLIEGNCSSKDINLDNLTYDGRKFDLEFTASSTCARAKSKIYWSKISCTDVKQGDRVNVYGVLNGNKITVQSIEDVNEMPVADWLPHSWGVDY